MSVENLILKIKRIAGFRQVKSPGDLGDELLTYAVVQGTNILSIGSGESRRLKTLMGNKGSHNKAPIIGLCNRIYKEPMLFYVCAYTSFPDNRRCSVEERELQKEFGETNIEGHKGYSEAMRHLRERLNLSEGHLESVLLDLMETHGDVLNHALNTQSTARVVEAMFGGYWKRARGIE